MSGHLTLPPLPDGVARDRVQLIHIQPIGYDHENQPLTLSLDGCHAFQVWVEISEENAPGWEHVPSMERHLPLLDDANAYAWALAAKYGVQVQLHDED